MRLQHPGHFERYFRALPAIVYLRSDVEPLLCNSLRQTLKQGSLEEENPHVADKLFR